MRLLLGLAQQMKCMKLSQTNSVYVRYIMGWFEVLGLEYTGLQCTLSFLACNTVCCYGQDSSTWKNMQWVVDRTVFRGLWCVDSDHSEVSVNIQASLT